MAVGIIIKIHKEGRYVPRVDLRVYIVGRLRAVASYKGGYIEQME